MKTNNCCYPWRGSCGTPGAVSGIDALYRWLEDENVLVLNRRLPFSHAETNAVTIHLTDTDDWGIFLDLSTMDTTAEEYTTLLHESGHYATGATHKLSSPYDLIEKHEYSANKWAVQRAVREDALDEAVAQGITDIPSLASHFGVTEDLMRKAVCLYTYGNIAAELYF